MIGRTISHYRIVSHLGAGGMGVVFAAEDDRLGRRVALKFVPEDLAKDPQAIERLRGEARTASGLNHPNICTIFDIDECEGRPFIAMELIDGRTLQERLTDGPLKVHEALDLGIQVADALEAAHERDIVHRDIKPANLFLTGRGHVKIVDFGLAKLVASRHTALTTTGVTRDQTAAGVTLGTVSYMSPEQVTGDVLDGRTDLFSLGVVLYECLTGRQPFTGKTSAMIFSAILTQAPVAPIVFNPEIPVRLQEAINNCLEKDRELRYQTASALRADLRRIKRDLDSGRSGVFRLPESTAASTAAAPRVHLKPVYLAAAAAAAIAVGVVAYRWLPQPTSPQPAPPPAAAPIAAAPAPQTEPRQTVEAPTTETKEYRDAIARAQATLRELKSKADSARQDAQQSHPAPPVVPAREPVHESPPAQPPRVEAPQITGLPSVPPAPFEPAPQPPPAAASGGRSAQAQTPSPVPAQTGSAAAGQQAPAPPPRPVETDDAAIRRVIGAYMRAIETKDVGLFKSVKPNISADEQRRVEDGFRAVDSQQIDVTILSIDVHGQDASVRLKRRDTIQAGGRQQTSESQQTMTLTRTNSGWVIREIGR